ncbi:Adaptive-response sensory-kinase SasA [subsurface metagenome]
MKRIYKKIEEKLTSEGTELRQPVAELEAPATEHKRLEETIHQQNEFLGNIILNSLPHPFYVIDANDYTIKMANPAARVGNLSENQTCYALTHKKDKPCGDTDHACPLEEVKKTRKPVIVEHIHYDEDGNARNIEVYGYPIFDTEGNVVQMIEYSLDITERKQAEKALRESEKIRNAVFSATPDLIAVLDRQWNIVDINEAMAKRFGKHQEELIGSSGWWNLLPPELAKSRKRRFNEVFQTGRPCRFEDERRGMWFDNIAYPVLQEQGEIKRIAIHAIDITERKQAEEKLQSILKTALDGFWLTNLEGRILEVNDSYCRMVGYTREELLKMSTSDLEAIENPGEVAQHIRRVIEQGYHSFESQHKRKDGKIIDVEISVNYLDVGEGQLFVFARDITERKQAEKALRESGEKYRGLVTNVKLGVFRSTPEPAGIFLEVNPAMAEITGYSRKELLKMNVSDLYVNSEERKVKLEEIASGRGKPTKEMRFRKKDGTEIVISDTKVAVRDDAGKVIYFDGIMEDITERKQMEEREKELQRELLLSSRLASIGELAAGVAHQINNPLTGVLGFSQRLLRKSTDQEINQDLKRIYTEAERAAKVVQNLLTFARRRQTQKQYSDINEILESALELRAYELTTSNIEVVTDLAPGLPEVMLDFHQIQEVFLNIILNAEQAMTDANSGGKLTIITVERRGHIRTTFTDNGPGIPAENLDMVFDPFFSTKGEKGGTGLGLSVCHGIISEHGGRMYAKSKPGKGATFFVELPLPAH